MKKMILGFAVVMAMVASVAAFASSNSNQSELNRNDSQKSVSVTGKGACRHALCKCQWYVSAGTGGKCVCGHWDYVHN